MLRRLAGLSLLLLAAGCSDPSTITLRSDRASVVIDRDPLRLRVLSASGEELLATLPITASSTLAYGTVAATMNPYEEVGQLVPGWDGYRPHEGAWQHALRATLQDHSDTSAALELELQPSPAAARSPGARATLEVSLDGPRVHLHVRTPGFEVTSVSFALPGDEHFFGLGERFASVDHRGLSLYAWAEEGGLGKGEGVPPGPENPFPNGPSMTYFPVPYFFSSRGYAVYIENTHRHELHFGSQRPDAWRLAVNTGAIDATIYVEPDPPAALALYTADTGRPMIPAPWVFGPRRRVGLGSEVDGLPEWQQLRARGVPTTALDDAVHFLPHRSEQGREAELSSWTATLHEHGFKALCYYNPFVSVSLPTAAEDYAYGKSHGLFIRDRSGNPGEAVLISGQLQTVASVDFTNPEARTWYDGILTRALRLGYDGWMHDFGEYVGRSWRFADGRMGDELHNAYPVLSAQAAHDTLEREKPGDYLFFVRSGWAGTQAVVPAVWGGDPEATFDDTQGLPSALRSGVNLGLSGVPYWGSDISGFKCFTDAPRDKEVYLRWAELGAVSPIMQDQNACTSVDGGKQKWTLWSDAETTEVYGAMARLHTRLQPYFLALAREANATGLPIMRHPVLSYPREPSAWAVDGAFFLGPSLYAAPVVARGARTKTTWLPPGRYVDLDDHRVYAGGQVADIPAPLAKLPLLLVAGQMVPLLDPSIETLAPATDPAVVTPERVRDRLDVVVALGPGQEASFELVDGTRVHAKRSATDAGNPGALAAVTDGAELATCTGCFLATHEGDVERLRVSTVSGTATRATLQDVELTTEGGPERRIRWDVLRLP